MTQDTLNLIRPDDWHIHFRDGDMLKTVVPATASVFRRAIVMPNLVPPVTTAAAARVYRQRILDACPPGSNFQPLMTAYLTETLDPDDLAAGHAAGDLTAVKLYPAGATTNSDAGVRDIRKVDATLKRMAEIGMPLLVHGEVTDPAIDIFDREAVFIERVLKPLMDRLSDLKIVLEHITTRQAVDYVATAGDHLAATITPHHMEINRTDIFRGGIRPHLYCLPIAKREEHRQAVRAAAVSGNPRFFLGTDSAPHPVHAKEAACGCAGIYNAPGALSVYAGMFEADGALDKLEGFASVNGPRFYGLPVNEEKITLRKTGWTVPDVVTTGGDTILPYHAGETLPWAVV
ncbi:dihydroorotase [Hwanghaeella sp. LZ110]|uniref:dihydroorotase n=1 Tax=Hwanghaeella sp. LZ110 TaxID=3402810 RepID=UPI003B66B49E